MLHVYRNRVIEWVVAESPEQALHLLAVYLVEECGYDPSEVDAQLTQEPDDKMLSMLCDGPDTHIEERVTKTCAEWAAEHGPGFLGTTER